MKGTGGKGATAVSRRDYLTKVVSMLVDVCAFASCLCCFVLCRYVVIACCLRPGTNVRTVGTDVDTNSKK